MASTRRPTYISDPDWEYDLPRHREMAQTYERRLAWEAAMREQGLRPLEIYRTPEAIAAAVETWSRQQSKGDGRTATACARDTFGKSSRNSSSGSPPSR